MLVARHCSCQRAKYAHADKLQWGAGRKEFHVSCLCPIPLVLFPFVIISQGCVYVVGHVRPVYPALNGVVHAAFC